MWKFIDKVIYINLDCRPDRMKFIEDDFRPIFGDKLERFPAIRDASGLNGCVRSHIAVLEMAIKNDWDNLLVIEDDAAWNKYEQGYNKLKVLTRNPFDVIVLGASAVTWDQTTLKLKGCNTTGCYLIKKHYMPVLLNNFKEGFKFLLETEDTSLYALDVYWNKLFERDNWFVLVPSMIYQRPSPKHSSQPEDGNVDYTNMFLLDFTPYPFARDSWPYLIDYGTEEQKNSILISSVIPKPISKPKLLSFLNRK